MSNVIRFLESMGSNPALTRLSAADYAAVVASLDVDGAQQDALRDRDGAALSDLLGGRAAMYCSQFPAREDEPAEKEQDLPDDDQREDNGDAASFPTHKQ